MHTPYADNEESEMSAHVDSKEEESGIEREFTLKWSDNKLPIPPSLECGR